MRLGFFLVGGKPAGDRPGDQLDGHQAGLLAGLLATHAVGDDEQIRGLEGERGHLAIALGTAVVPDRPPAGNEEVVFVMVAVIAPNRDNPHPQLELARQQSERRKRRELFGRGVVVIGVSLTKEAFQPVQQSRKPAHVGFTLWQENRFSHSIVTPACFPANALFGSRVSTKRPSSPV